jgi:hypothetical protein
LANGAVELHRIDATQPRAGACFEFSAVLTTADGVAFVVAVSPAELRSYSLFQIAILSRGGQLYRHAWCEGKPAEAQDEMFRSLVVMSLQHVPRAGSDAEALN